MGKGGGKCASRDQSASSSRTPRLPAPRSRKALIEASAQASKPNSKKEKVIGSDPTTLVPLIPKEDQKEVLSSSHSKLDDDDGIDTNVTFDQDVDYSASDSQRRLTSVSSSEMPSVYNTANVSPARSFSSGGRSPDTLYLSGSEDLPLYKASLVRPVGIPLPPKYLKAGLSSPDPLVYNPNNDDDLFLTKRAPAASSSGVAGSRSGGLRKRHSIATSSSTTPFEARSLTTSSSFPAPSGRAEENPLPRNVGQTTEEAIPLRKRESKEVIAHSIAVVTVAIEDDPKSNSPQRAKPSSKETLGDNWEMVSPVHQQFKGLSLEWVSVLKPNATDTSLQVASVQGSNEVVGSQQVGESVIVEPVGESNPIATPTKSFDEPAVVVEEKDLPMSIEELHIDEESSPIEEGKETSLAPVLSPIVEEEFALAIVSQDGAAPTPVFEEESASLGDILKEVPLVVAEDVIVPTPTVDKHAVLALVLENESAPTTVIEEESAPMGFIEKEVAPVVVLEEEFAPILVHKEHATPAFVLEKESTPVGVVEEELAPAIVPEDEASPTPVFEEESALISVSREKVPPTIVPEHQTAVSPVGKDEAAPTPMLEKESTLAPIVDERAAPTSFIEKKGVPAVFAKDKSASTPVIDEHKSIARVVEEEPPPLPMLVKEPATVVQTKGVAATSNVAKKEASHDTFIAKQPLASLNKGKQSTNYNVKKAHRIEKMAASVLSVEEKEMKGPSKVEEGGVARDVEEEISHVPSVAEEEVRAPLVEHEDAVVAPFEDTPPSPSVEEKSVPTAIAHEEVPPTEPEPEPESQPASLDSVEEKEMGGPSKVEEGGVAPDAGEEISHVPSVAEEEVRAPLVEHEDAVVAPFEDTPPSPSVEEKSVPTAVAHEEVPPTEPEPEPESQPASLDSVEEKEMGGPSKVEEGGIARDVEEEISHVPSVAEEEVRAPLVEHEDAVVAPFEDTPPSPSVEEKSVPTAVAHEEVPPTEPEPEPESQPASLDSVEEKEMGGPSKVEEGGVARDVEEEISHVPSVAEEEVRAPLVEHEDAVVAPFEDTPPSPSVEEKSVPTAVAHEEVPPTEPEPEPESQPASLDSVEEKEMGGPSKVEEGGVAPDVGEEISHVPSVAEEEVRAPLVEHGDAVVAPFEDIPPSPSVEEKSVPTAVAHEEVSPTEPEPEPESQPASLDSVEEKEMGGPSKVEEGGVALDVEEEISHVPSVAEEEVRAPLVEHEDAVVAPFEDTPPSPSVEEKSVPTAVAHEEVPPTEPEPEPESQPASLDSVEEKEMGGPSKVEEGGVALDVEEEISHVPSVAEEEVRAPLVEHEDAVVAPFEDTPPSPSVEEKSVPTAVAHEEVPPTEPESQPASLDSVEEKEMGGPSKVEEGGVARDVEEEISHVPSVAEEEVRAPLVEHEDAVVAPFEDTPPSPSVEEKSVPTAVAHEEVPPTEPEPEPESQPASLDSVEEKEMGGPSKVEEGGVARDVEEEISHVPSVAEEEVRAPLVEHEDAVVAPFEDTPPSPSVEEKSVPTAVAHEEVPPTEPEPEPESQPASLDSVEEKEMGGPSKVEEGGVARDVEEEISHVPSVAEEEVRAPLVEHEDAVVAPFEDTPPSPSVEEKSVPTAVAHEEVPPTEPEPEPESQPASLDSVEEKEMGGPSKVEEGGVALDAGEEISHVPSVAEEEVRAPLVEHEDAVVAPFEDTPPSPSVEEKSVPTAVAHEEVPPTEPEPEPESQPASLDSVEEKEMGGPSKVEEGGVALDVEEEISHVPSVAEEEVRAPLVEHEDAVVAPFEDTPPSPSVEEKSVPTAVAHEEVPPIEPEPEPESQPASLDSVEEKEMEGPSKVEEGGVARDVEEEISHVPSIAEEEVRAPLVEHEDAVVAPFEDTPPSPSVEEKSVPTAVAHEEVPPTEPEPEPESQPASLDSVEEKEMGGPSKVEEGGVARDVEEEISHVPSVAEEEVRAPLVEHEDAVVAPFEDTPPSPSVEEKSVPTAVAHEEVPPTEPEPEPESQPASLDSVEEKEMGGPSKVEEGGVALDVEEEISHVPSVAEEEVRAPLVEHEDAVVAPFEDTPPSPSVEEKSVPTAVAHEEVPPIEPEPEPESQPASLDSVEEKEMEGPSKVEEGGVARDVEEEISHVPSIAEEEVRAPLVEHEDAVVAPFEDTPPSPSVEEKSVPTAVAHEEVPPTEPEPEPESQPASLDSVEEKEMGGPSKVEEGGVARDVEEEISHVPSVAEEEVRAPLVEHEDAVVAPFEDTPPSPSVEEKSVPTAVAHEEVPPTEPEPEPESQPASLDSVEEKEMGGPSKVEEGGVALDVEEEISHVPSVAEEEVRAPLVEHEDAVVAPFEDTPPSPSVEEKSVPTAVAHEEVPPTEPEPEPESQPASLDSVEEKEMGGPSKVEEGGVALDVEEEISHVPSVAEEEVRAPLVEHEDAVVAPFEDTPPSPSVEEKSVPTAVAHEEVPPTEPEPEPESQPASLDSVEEKEMGGPSKVEEGGVALDVEEEISHVPSVAEEEVRAPLVEHEDAVVAPFEDTPPSPSVEEKSVPTAVAHEEVPPTEPEPEPESQPASLDSVEEKEMEGPSKVEEGGVALDVGEEISHVPSVAEEEVRAPLVEHEDAVVAPFEDTPPSPSVEEKSVPTAVAHEEVPPTEPEPEPESQPASLDSVEEKEMGGPSKVEEGGVAPDAGEEISHVPSVAEEEVRAPLVEHEDAVVAPFEDTPPSPSVEEKSVPTAVAHEEVPPTEPEPEPESQPASLDSVEEKEMEGPSKVEEGGVARDVEEEISHVPSVAEEEVRAPLVEHEDAVVAPFEDTPPSPSVEEKSVPTAVAHEEVPPTEPEPEPESQPASLDSVEEKEMGGPSKVEEGGVALDVGEEISHVPSVAEEEVRAPLVEHEDAVVAPFEDTPPSPSVEEKSVPTAVAHEEVPPTEPEPEPESQPASLDSVEEKEMEGPSKVEEGGVARDVEEEISHVPSVAEEEVRAPLVEHEDAVVAPFEDTPPSPSVEEKSVQTAVAHEEVPPSEPESQPASLDSVEEKEMGGPSKVEEGGVARDVEEEISHVPSVAEEEVRAPLVEHEDAVVAPFEDTPPSPSVEEKSVPTAVAHEEVPPTEPEPEPESQPASLDSVEEKEMGGPSKVEEGGVARDVEEEISHVPSVAEEEVRAPLVEHEDAVVAPFEDTPPSPSVEEKSVPTAVAHEEVPPTEPEPESKPASLDSVEEKEMGGPSKVEEGGVALDVEEEISHVPSVAEEEVRAPLVEHEDAVVAPFEDTPPSLSVEEKSGPTAVAHEEVPPTEPEPEPESQAASLDSVEEKEMGGPSKVEEGGVARDVEEEISHVPSVAEEEVRAPLVEHEDAVVAPFEDTPSSPSMGEKSVPTAVAHEEIPPTEPESQPASLDSVEEKEIGGPSKVEEGGVARDVEEEISHVRSFEEKEMPVGGAYFEGGAGVMALAFEEEASHTEVVMKESSLVGFDEEKVVPTSVVAEEVVDRIVEEDEASPLVIQEEATSARLLEKEFNLVGVVEEETIPHSIVQVGATPVVVGSREETNCVVEENIASFLVVEEKAAPTFVLDKDSTLADVAEEEAGLTHANDKEFAPNPIVEESVVLVPVVEEETVLDSVIEEHVALVPIVEEDGACSHVVVECAASLLVVVKEETDPVVEEDAASPLVVEEKATPILVLKKESTPACVNEEDVAPTSLLVEVSATTNIIEDATNTAPIKEERTFLIPVVEKAVVASVQEKEVAAVGVVKKESVVASVVEKDTTPILIIEDKVAPTQAIIEECATPSLIVEEKGATTRVVEEEFAPAIVVEDGTTIAVVVEQDATLSNVAEEESTKDIIMQEEASAPVAEESKVSTFTVETSVEGESVLDVEEELSASIEREVSYLVEESPIDVVTIPVLEEEEELPESIKDEVRAPIGGEAKVSTVAPKVEAPILASTAVIKEELLGPEVQDPLVTRVEDASIVEGSSRVVEEKEFSVEVLEEVVAPVLIGATILSLEVLAKEFPDSVEGSHVVDVAPVSLVNQQEISGGAPIKDVAPEDLALVVESSEELGETSPVVVEEEVPNEGGTPKIIAKYASVYLANLVDVIPTELVEEEVVLNRDPLTVVANDKPTSTTIAEDASRALSDFDEVPDPLVEEDTGPIEVTTNEAFPSNHIEDKNFSAPVVDEEPAIQSIADKSEVPTSAIEEEIALGPIAEEESATGSEFEGVSSPIADLEKEATPAPATDEVKVAGNFIQEEASDPFTNREAIPAIVITTEVTPSHVVKEEAASTPIVHESTTILDDNSWRRKLRMMLLSAPIATPVASSNERETVKEEKELPIAIGEDLAFAIEVVPVAAHYTLVVEEEDQLAPTGHKSGLRMMLLSTPIAAPIASSNERETVKEEKELLAAIGEDLAFASEVAPVAAKKEIATPLVVEENEMRTVVVEDESSPASLAEQAASTFISKDKDVIVPVAEEGATSTAVSLEVAPTLAIEQEEVAPVPIIEDTSRISFVEEKNVWNRFVEDEAGGAHAHNSISEDKEPTSVPVVEEKAILAPAMEEIEKANSALVAEEEVAPTAIAGEEHVSIVDKDATLGVAVVKEEAGLAKAEAASTLVVEEKELAFVPTVEETVPSLALKDMEEATSTPVTIEEIAPAPTIVEEAAPAPVPIIEKDGTFGHAVDKERILAPVVEGKVGPAGIEDEAIASASVVEEKELVPMPVVEKEGFASDKKEDLAPFNEVDVAHFKEMEIPALVVEEEATSSPIAEEIMSEGLAPKVVGEDEAPFVQDNIVKLPIRAFDEATPFIKNKPKVASTPKESLPTKKITTPGEEAAIATSANLKAPELVPRSLLVESNTVDLDVPIVKVSTTTEAFPREVLSPLMVDTPEVDTLAVNPKHVESGDFPGVVAEKIDPIGSTEAKKTVENSWRDFMEEMENESITPALAAPIA